MIRFIENHIYHENLVSFAGLITLIGVTAAGSTKVLAQTTLSGPFSGLIDKIAQRFNLNRSDVQSVFDQYKDDRKNMMETKFTQQLDTAVSSGKITEAQKQLILAKRQELQANRVSNLEKFKNMTPDERKKAISDERQALIDWAKQNNIDLALLTGRGLGHFKGMGMGRG